MDRSTPILANEWYHVYNRGNNHCTLFHDASDYRVFRAKLEQALAKYNVACLAYALMPNHFHAILMQRTGGNLPHMMASTCTSYAKRYNLRHNHSGHVFQGRYHYRHVPSEEALRNVARYIHLNPVRARLVSRPERWEFSDYERHTIKGGQQTGDGFLSCKDGKSYEQFVQEGIENIHVLRQRLFDP